MTPTIQQNIRAMVYSVANNDFATAKTHIREVVREKIKSRYTSIAQKIDEGNNK